MGDNGTLTWWVDASYAVHDDMHGHTGGTLSAGTWSMYSTSNKQKLVSRSSTEAELIGVYDVMPQLTWVANFLWAQDMDLKCVILKQDNMSSILLEKNGQASSSKCTKHIAIQYFYIKERVDSKEVDIEYCPTEEMVADFSTKPLQGNLSWKLHDQIMRLDMSVVHTAQVTGVCWASRTGDGGHTNKSRMGKRIPCLIPRLVPHITERDIRANGHAR